MSNYYTKSTGLAGIDFLNINESGMRALVRRFLEEKIHGICFSPYAEGQGPGTELGRQQVSERLDVIAPHTRWVRSFSCTEGNQLIPELAKEKGLQTMVGVWLDEDLDNNEKELANAIQLAQAGYVDILAVGNEVLLRGDLSEEQLIDYIQRAKQALPNIDVGYVDAYFEFEDHPDVTEVCDVILANCYPFWEGCPVEHALLYMKEMYRRAQKAAGGKRVIISETGWPSLGTAERGAEPSPENAIKYFLNTYTWADQEDIEIFYFSVFDEAWKVGDEGDVGAYWGLWDTHGNLKYG